MKNEDFKFSPIIPSILRGKEKQIYINKTNGKTRSLIIIPLKDKIIQAGMKILLECIFEPIFLNTSHGFRPNRNSHTALQQINQKFNEST